MSLSPFDFLSAINDTKAQLIVDDVTEKAYNGFMVNRGLSYFQDTILIANEMNLNAHLDKKLQFDFLINIVRKRKRFSKWAKAEVADDLEVVKEFYGYSNEKARQTMSLLTPEQITTLKAKLSKGGKRK
jgi:hypothetical protein